MINFDPPIRWPLVPIKRFAQLVYGDALPAEKREDGGEVPVYGSNGAFGSHSSANTSSPVILIGRKGSVGALNWSEQPAFAIDTVYFVDEVPSNCDLRWLYWALHTAGLHHLSQDTGVPGLSREMAYGVALPLAPLPEQKAIAAFLDRETDKIDALVEEQKRLIELLKEKRQAVISHAVTKGLDPNARMKPSGVEWLGDIPEHWEVLPLKRLGAFEAGAGFPEGEQGVEGEELPFFKVNALSKADAGVLLPPDDTVSRETAARLRAFVFPAGTIAFAKIGAALLLGRLRTTPREACLDNNMMGYMVGAGHSPDFLIHAMSLVRFDLIANPGTVPSLNKSQIEGVTIAVPPLAEQLAITCELRQRLADIDALAQVSEDAMKLLAERRSALISAAVTGKIDVRDIATQEDAA